MPKGEKFLSKNDVPVCFPTSFSKKKTARRRSEFREEFKLYAVFLLDDFV